MNFRGGFVMKKKKWSRVLAVLLAMVTSISLLSGCGRKIAEKEDTEGGRVGQV